MWKKLGKNVFRLKNHIFFSMKASNNSYPETWKTRWSFVFSISPESTRSITTAIESKFVLVCSIASRKTSQVCHTNGSCRPKKVKTKGSDWNGDIKARMSSRIVGSTGYPGSLVPFPSLWGAQGVGETIHIYWRVKLSRYNQDRMDKQ